MDVGLLKTIFEIPNKVFEFNARIFPQLETKQTKWNESSFNETICDVIYNNCREVKVYEEFLENSCEIFKCLEKLCQSPSVKKIVDDLDEKVCLLFDWTFSCDWSQIKLKNPILK